MVTLEDIQTYMTPPGEDNVETYLPDGRMEAAETLLTEAYLRCVEQGKIPGITTENFLEEDVPPNIAEQAESFEDVTIDMLIDEAFMPEMFTCGGPGIEVESALLEMCAKILEEQNV